MCQRQRHRTENSLNNSHSSSSNSFLNILPSNLLPSPNNSHKTIIPGNLSKNSPSDNHPRLSINTVIELQSPNRTNGMFKIYFLFSILGGVAL